MGLPLCTGLLTIKHSRTGQFCNSSPITDLSAHTFMSCGDGRVAKATGVGVNTGGCSHKPGRMRSMGKWLLFFLNPKATGEFCSACRQLGSLFRNALPALQWGRGLEKIPRTNACPSSVWSVYRGWRTHPHSGRTTMQKIKTQKDYLWGMEYPNITE